MEENLEIVNENNINQEGNYSVYMHTSPSGKRYIGMTGQNPPERRWRNGHAYQNNMHFYRAIKKYGWDNFCHEVLFNELTKEEAEKKEIELIAFYKSNNQNFGYNIENGGNHTGKHSEDTKKKISKSNIGRVVSEEQRRKMSKTLTGRKLSAQWIENRSKAQTGLKRNKSTKEKISDSVSKKVICINDRVVYKSLTEASEVTGANISHISCCCNKSRKAAGTSDSGEYLYWMFYDEYIKNGYENKTNDEIIQKRQRDNKPKSVICLNNKIVYQNMQIACDETKLSKSGISMCCNGKQQYCGKDEYGNHIYWMFYDEYLEKEMANE